MFSPAVARHLTDLGHDRQHVRDLDLAGRTDDEVFDRATVEDRVVVTENAVDLVALLDAAAGAGAVTPPVVLALKRTLPADAGAMANELGAAPLEGRRGLLVRRAASGVAVEASGWSALIRPDSRLRQGYVRRF